MEDILQTFKATGSLRRSMATVSMSSMKPTSKILLTSSSMNTLKDRTELSAPIGKSKGDRVAEILLRVKSLTKKLDGKSKNSNDPNSNQNALNIAGGVSDSTDSSLMMKGRNKMENKNIGKIDNENDNDNDTVNEKLDSSWSLSNPMHLDRVEKRGGAEGGKDRDRENNNLSKIEEEDDNIDLNENKDRGKDRRMRPHRYGQVEEGEEEAEEANLISHHDETDHHGINDVTDNHDDDNDSDERTKEYSESDRLL